jgi:hypothetical protein
MDTTPCAKSELLLFHKPIQQVSTTRGVWVDYHPVSSLKDGPIEFYMAASATDYADLNDTVLYMKLQVLTADNKPIAKPQAQYIAPVNLLHSSLFQDVEVFMNNQQVEGLNSLYAYKSYLLSLLEFGKEVKKTQCRAAGYFADEAGEFDEIKNNGHEMRVAWNNGSEPFEVVGPIWVDIFQQPRYILPRVDLRIRLIPSKFNFSLMNFGTGGVKIVIQDAILYMRKVKVAEGVLKGHELGLRKSNAIYPINRTKMQTFTIPAGGTNFTKDNLFPTQSPKLVFVCMVTNRALNGDYKRNPFNLQHFNVNFIGLYRDGQSVPIPAHTPNFEKGLYSRSYIQLIQAVETYNKNICNSITMDDFAQGSTIFAFNLSADLDATSCHQQPYINGNYRLELKFASALPESINVIICAIFDSKIEIRENRSVIKDNL